VFTYTPAALKPTAKLIQNLEALVQGDVLAPGEVEQKIDRRFRLLGPQGLVGIALVAIDMALWDARARVHRTPTAHWPEYADGWNPILAEPLRIEKGMAIIDGAIGTGVEWNEDAVSQFSP
jgi:L-alanine-DL-glutamate epimerase-like enolase superfamily enzyme